MKILLPVDGSGYTQKTLDYLVERHEWVCRGHEFIFFTAMAPVPAHLHHLLEGGMVELHHRDEARKVLRPVTAFAERQRWTIKASYEVGHAVDVIEHMARTRGADLIVMGAQGGSGKAGASLGSVSSGVLARCKVPVLLVR